MRQFHLMMAEKTQQPTRIVDDDLGPPPFFLDAMADLRIILGAYDSSSVPGVSGNDDLRAILESSLTPYIRRCEELSGSLPGLSATIMLYNCGDLAQVGDRWQC
jgi:Conserved Oligomeric Golgi complex subunit 6, C-terminal